MLVDKQSLIDLGVLPNGAGEWPLGRLLDHTHSRPGLEALKRLLATPLADLGEIRARQRLFAQLPDALRHVTWKPLVALAKDVESYLESNYILVPDGPSAYALFALRYRPITAYVQARLLALSQLLELCSDVRDCLWPLEGDTAFQSLYGCLDAVVSGPLRMTLREAARAPSSRGHRLCRLDHQVRVGAREAIGELINALYLLDAYASLAAAASAPHQCYPDLTEDRASALQLQTLRHPLIAKGVANDVDLPHGERVVFLTGPNMAGKSTLLRAVGIAVHFAHLGLPVAATRARVPRVDRLISSLRVEDSITRGESLYLAEVRRVKAVVNAVASGNTVVALLDEVFRGTNVKDAVDATALMVDGLSRAPSGLFFVASHLAEVAERRPHREHVGLWCMQVDETGDTHAFTYALRRGVSDVRLGMRLLESEGVTGVLRALARGG